MSHPCLKCLIKYKCDSYCDTFITFNKTKDFRTLCHLTKCEFGKSCRLCTVEVLEKEIDNESSMSYLFNKV